MDDEDRTAALAIQGAGGELAGPLQSSTAQAMLGLPLRLGGCGLPIPSDPIPGAARLSSAALTQAALRNGHSSCRPYAGQCRGTLLANMEQTP
jgi:hypothetical protein